ncbi:uncharacterized protein LOC125681144 isoform X1 [Ostrea edulis]|uniref:uncharacterized protein LOC125681144 isoform X1 n=1 Tax=Ostrea edulis TaxID=37623 RepID=UPI0024AE9A0D|nr:uncharacterized protein LOC125681144 isoform X1 [Ostrea edulis]
MTTKSPNQVQLLTCGERRRLKYGAAPSVFDFKNTSTTQESDRAKQKRLRESTQDTCTPMIEDLPMYMDELIVHHEVVVDQSSTSMSTSMPEEMCSTAEKEIQCDIPTLGRFSIEGMKLDTKMLSYYTGLNGYDHFMLLFNILGPAAFDLNYKCGLLSPQDQLFLTLMKLRQAKEDVELAMLFKVCESTVSKIVTTWINFLYFQLKELEEQFWPSKDIIKEHMPTDFAKKFPNTRVILDATEQPIHKPSNVEAQSKTWSSYKHKNTLKTMVGVTPNGAVSYVSSTYGGSMSDRQITEHSTLLDVGKFDAGDSIMADWGILVQDLFANQNVFINTPTFLKGKSQLDPEEIVRDRRVASKRIHVERVIGLAKRFKILKHELPMSKIPLASRIVYICFMLSNFRNCIVDKSA